MGYSGGDPRSLARRPDDPAELLGQVLTPGPLALLMSRMLLQRRPGHPVIILDPATGPATFPTAMARTGLLDPRDRLVLHDIDRTMIEHASSWSRAASWDCRLHHQDYLMSEDEGLFDLVILNPPYVRQEWIDNKEAYRERFRRRYRLHIPGTANLYVYFLVKSVREMKAGGHLCAIVYDSWQSTRFGAWLAEFLHQECDVIRRIPISGRPFRGRLIDATILLMRRRSPRASESVSVAAGDVRPDRLRPLADVAGLVAVETLFQTRRGLRLKQSDFFRTTLADVSRLGATPFVKKSNHIAGYRVPDDHPEAAFLLSRRHADARVRCELLKRLRIAQTHPADNVSILTWHRERPETWAEHREPPHAPFLFNYYLRKRPRHLYNPSRAYADNFYGLTPRFDLHPSIVLAVLNATCFCIEILAQSRNQGSGLSKVQLFEYRRAHLPDWRGFSTTGLRRLRSCGDALLKATAPADALIQRIDAILAAELGAPGLRPPALHALYREIDRRAKSPAAEYERGR
jgi:hypothetical protein